jgi:hypothetical protein
MPTSLSGVLPLFMQVDEATGVASSLPLFAFGSTGSGQFAGFPLWMSGANLVEGDIPLYLQAETLGTGQWAIPLYLLADAPRADATLPLYLENIGATGYLPLYIAGSGITDGAIPFNASLPLFIERAEGYYLPLFLKAPGTPSSGNFPLYTLGADSFSGSLPLYASGIGVGEAALKLYMFGF